MGVIAWIIFGIITGVIANAIDPRPSQGGIFGATLLGIAGAIVGGFIGNALLGFDVTGFNLTSFLVAVGGSLLLLFLGRAFTRRTL